VDEVSKQYGAQGGALSGQAVVRSLSQLLSQISTYTGGGQITGLADIGLDLDKTGHLTFSPLNLMAADMTNSSGVDAFLGSTSSGGFLKLLTDSLNSVQDPTSGLIPSAEAGITTQTTNIDNTIADEQDRVDKLTAQLQQQMSSADALIASMEQQYNYMSSLFQAQDTAAKQYQ
jgi:flagellar hook-associated protein 2